MKFDNLSESYIQKFVDKYLPRPKRGGKYSKEEWKSIANWMWFVSPPREELKQELFSKSRNEGWIGNHDFFKLLDIWDKQIIEWEEELRKIPDFINSGLYNALFYSGENYSDAINLERRSGQFHPFAIMYRHSSYSRGPFSVDGDTRNGVDCKYGDCFYSKLENRTLENTKKSIIWAIQKVDKNLLEYLSDTLDVKLYDGSLPFDVWYHKYKSSGNFYTNFLETIAKRVYGLKESHRGNFSEIAESHIEGMKREKAVSSQPEKPSQPIQPNVDQSKNTGFIKVGYRTEFLTTPILYGRERILILANGEKHRAQYAIVELDNILASHNEYSFTDTENYPVNARNENINDRNYSGDINAQAKVIDIAQNFEPETQISTSATASGLLVITIDGIVVSGNNRTMSFKRMVKDFPEKYNEYLKTLQGEIVSFGFTQHVGTALIMKDSIPLSGSSYNEPLSVKFEQPILVRIDYDFPAYNTTEMNKYNKDTKKAERPIDRAIKLSSMLLDNEKAINIISDLLLPYETLSDFYANVIDVKRLKQALIDNNILTAQETPNYFTDVNTLTVNGKEFLLNLLAGMILDKDALISSEMEGVKRLKEKLVAALPAVIKNSKLPEGSLKNEINQAIVLQQQMVAVGMNISDYIRSPKLFDTSENFSTKAYYINELLNGTKYAFKAALESYNKAIISNQGASMFGDQLTADDIFEKTMVAKVDQDIVNIIKSFGKKPEAPIAKQINNEKEKARARARAKLKLSKVQTTIMAKGGNIVLPDNLTELQRNTINKIYTDWKEKINEKNVQLKNAKNAKSKAQNEIQLRCGLFGDTKSDPRQSALFQTELVCNDITFNNSLKPYDLRIRQIEMDIENITENTKKQIYAAMHQTEMALMRQGGNAGCDKGCTVEGKTHENGGEKFSIKETGQIVELEVDEAVIKADAVKSERTYMFEGKNMTTAAILNKINTDHGGNPIH